MNSFRFVKYQLGWELHLLLWFWEDPYQVPTGTSDKRALIFNASDVEEIANETGEKEKTVRNGPGQRNKSRQNNNR